ncbi:MAG: hypothetical protein H6746_10700 [Deltaproteobacteria bacterium]|nr:hypothetical protein [Deltaproteobacteria bacterium]
MRARWGLAIVCGALLWASVAEAAPMRFGYSGVHALPAKVWAPLSDDARALFVADRIAQAERLGAQVLRLGSTTPRLIDFALIHKGQFRNWLFADRVVGLLSAAPLDVCLTLPELFDTPDIGAFQAFIDALAERYDGDNQFGVAPAALGHEFPDLNASGEITSNEFELPADAPEVVAWGEAHRIDLIEPGDEPLLAELTSKLSTGAYAAQVKAAHTAVVSAGGGQRVMLAGTAVDHPKASKSSFVARLPGLSIGGPWFDAANVHLATSLDDLTGVPAATDVAKFQNWLEAVGHGSAERWIGALSIGSEPGPDRVCSDPRCSERTQAASLVRQLVLAAAGGVSVVLYAEPIEVVGTTATPGPRTGTGLLTLDLPDGVDPFPREGHPPLRLTPRPAYAVWRRLTAVLGAEGATVTALSGMPENVRGFRVGQQGYVLWHDWSEEVQPGAPWSGPPRPVTLEGQGSRSVRVVSLWPASVESSLAADGSAQATWDETLVAVTGGTARLTLGKDPVWVEASTEVVEGPADDGPADAASDTSVAEGAELSADSGGGCAGAPGGVELPWAALLALVGLVALGGRRGRAQARM